MFYRTFPVPTLLLLMTALGPAQAQNLATLYAAAKQHDSVYLSATAQHQASRSRAEQTLAGLLPRAALKASSVRSMAEISPYGVVGSTGTTRYFSTHAAGINALQPLYNPANRLLYEQSRLQLAQADQILLLAEQDLLLKTSQAYFDVLTSQDSLKFVQAQKNAVGEQLASAKRNFEIGTATITDTREAQARFDLITAQQIAAENDFRIKGLALDQLVGLNRVKPLPLKAKATLPVPMPDDLDVWVDRALLAHPSLITAQVNVETAKLEIDRAQAGHHPTLDLVAGLSHTDNAGGSVGSGVSNRAMNQSVGLELNVPLFSGFSVQNRIAESIAQEEKARFDLESVRRTVTHSVRSAYLGTQSGLSQVKALEAAEVSSQLALDANKLGYSVGVRINIDVLNAQSQLYQTKRDLAKSRYDALLGFLRLQQASGSLQTQDLELISALFE